jgi:hypothetical protein
MLEVRSRKRYGTAASNHASKLSVLVSTLCQYAGGAACGDFSNWQLLRDPRASIISGNGMAYYNLPKSSALSVNQQSQPSADGIVKASSVVTLVDCDISCQRFVFGSFPFLLSTALSRFQSKTLPISAGHLHILQQP